MPQHNNYVAHTLEQQHVGGVAAAAATASQDAPQFSEPVRINEPRNVFAHAAYQRSVHVTPDVLISAGGSDDDDAASYRDGADMQNATFSTLSALEGWQQWAAQVAIQVLIIATAVLLLLYFVRTVARYWRRRRRQAAAVTTTTTTTLMPSSAALRHRLKSQ